jgi:leader peptidase (prepilin peptidase)/N-methyltransferase
MNKILGLLTSFTVSLILSIILTKVSKRMEYDYKGRKKEIISIVLAVVFSTTLTYLVYLNYSILSIEGYLYLLLFIIAGTISISSSFIDLKYREIPDEYNLITAIVGVLSVFIFNSLINEAIITGAIMFGIYFLIMAVTNAMGGGDVKMVGALGILVPFSQIGLFLLLPFIVGAVISIFLIVTKKRKKDDMVPFGPFITIGFLLTTLNFWYPIF